MDAWMQYQLRSKDGDEYNLCGQCQRPGGCSPEPPASAAPDKLLIVTCMEAHFNIRAAFGIAEDDAYLVRNPGGSARDAIPYIVTSQLLSGTREIAIVHHTGCSMGKHKEMQDKILHILSDSDADQAAEIAKIDFFALSNSAEQGVGEDVQLIKKHPLVHRDTVVTGWILDASGKVAPAT
ncbi:carbonic anhydrase [Auriculariales sp. MPI-PUGE-AT-0066]|nr:carbonic anhydrase [Auriculariales sp. MPI-PUGE-AT-0066]